MTKRLTLLDRRFEFLLNAFEVASQSENPAAEGYAEKRRALFRYVIALQHRAARSDSTSNTTPNARPERDEVPR